MNLRRGILVFLCFAMLVSFAACSLTPSGPQVVAQYESKKDNLTYQFVLLDNGATYIYNADFNIMTESLKDQTPSRFAASCKELGAIETTINQQLFEEIFEEVFGGTVAMLQNHPNGLVYKEFLGEHNGDTVHIFITMDNKVYAEISEYIGELEVTSANKEESAKTVKLTFGTTEVTPPDQATFDSYLKMPK